MLTFEESYHQLMGVGEWVRGDFDTIINEIASKYRYSDSRTFREFMYLETSLYCNDNDMLDTHLRIPKYYDRR